MEEKIIEQIKESLNKEERNSKRITRALRALESGCYPVAIKAAYLVLTEAEFIEQRMAALAIKQVAELKDDKVTEEFLATSYYI